jgi:outer membrane protein assembly factor BamB
MNSPVVWGKRLFLTGADESSRRVFCFETETGSLLWQHEVNEIEGSPSRDKLPNVMETSGLAAPTVTTNGLYVAAIFATGDLVCLNMEGKRIWARNLGIPHNQYGHASSLISNENLLFVQYDQEEDSRLLAFGLASGDVVWSAKRGAISWSSPILVDNRGRMELILTNCKAVDSYDPGTGKMLWNMEGLRGEVAPSAAYSDGVVYVANEYSAAFAIEIGSHVSKPKLLWQWADVLPDVASPLANEDYLIIASGYGIVDCLSARTGKVLWEHEFDKGFYSSPILVNDRVYLMDRSGVMQVFMMADKFELLGTAAIGEKANATPAFVGDRIYIRGETHLFCIGERK